jgi:hypothetical protein
MKISEINLQIKRNLVRQFQTITVPNACVEVLVTWILHIHDANKILAKGPHEDLERYVGKIFDLVWKWATRLRTDEELQILLDRKCTCSPEERRTIMHRAKRPAQWASADSSPGWQVVGACLEVVAQVDETDVVPLNKFHRRKTWPRSIRSILPHGSASTVKGLCQWLKYKTEGGDRRAVLLSLNSMISLLEPLVVPHLIGSRAFLHGTLYRLKFDEQLLAIVRSEPAQSPNITAAGRDTPFSVLVQDYLLAIPVMAKLLLRTSNETERRVFHRHERKKLLAAYEGAIVISQYALSLNRQPFLSRADRIQDIEKDLQALACILYLDCYTSGVFDFTNPRHVALVGPNAALVPSAPTPEERFDLELRHITDIPRCLAPGCIKTMADSHLKLCLGCLQVQYCSRRCQKRGWTNAQTGHRSWCKMVANPSTMTSRDDYKKVLHILEQLTLSKLRVFNPGVKVSL